MKTAAFPIRLLAYNVDISIFIIVALVLSVFIESNLVLYASCALFVILYHATLESSSWQATLGKKYVKMKVVDDKEQPISFFKGICRILAKFLSLILAFAGFFMIYFRSDRKGLHDLICGTKVILVTESRERNTIKNHKVKKT
ncbi:RDD family protein [Reichenbachiella versicolor]|uniref:RDD family protein n=1 Tax=Reichenbachiella versicolor TaxID=1821036 RepID=UPI0013A56C98|nr:RDD family protein [Reichenbachiella versicolor]